MFRCRRASKGLRKGYWERLFIPEFLIALIVPAWADDKSADEETLRRAHSKELRKCFLD